MSTPRNVQTALPELFDPRISIKIIEAAKPHDPAQPDGIQRMPHYTYTGGPNKWHYAKSMGIRSTRLTTDTTGWTQGFFPGMMRLLVERARLMDKAFHHIYSVDEIQQLARHWQDSFRFLARPSENHDQGFRFQLSFGKWVRARWG